jgi:hypothetical protein
MTSNDLSKVRAIFLYDENVEMIHIWINFSDHIL